MVICWKVVNIMKPDLAKHLSAFLGTYLPDIKGASSHTVSSYSDTFRLFLNFCQNDKGKQPEKLYVKDITYDLIIEFLEWLESARGCSVSTRNQRQAAICSFLRYVQVYTPACMGEIQNILAIPFKKKKSVEINYISFEDIKRILEQPDTTKKNGRRDRIMMCLLYDTGARVSELTNLRARDVRLVAPARITLYGKGMKQRSVPLMDDTKRILEQYMEERELIKKENQSEYLFTNHQGQKFTRAGITYILNKYIKKAKSVSIRIPEKISPHIFRHSKAMHLLQAGVNIIYIKDILGHVDVTTTQMYLKADMEMKREALEKAKIEISNASETPLWTDDTTLMQWLTELGQRTRM